ncbi:DUF7576 family protein [Halomarina ordinaria]|uniref:TRASH domain-containing protein n=1 Tax=Halomarina ordinaria TaxID=3033939 RepID=A0ABD5U483_9EURY|nr:hypothetical protein [Halomarina sp. PSRA2]
MVDPTSDLDDDVDESNAPRCAVCDDPLIRDPNHRVVTWVEDAKAHTAHFCGPDCRDAWDGPPA